MKHAPRDEYADFCADLQSHIKDPPILRAYDVMDDAILMPSAPSQETVWLDEAQAASLIRTLLAEAQDELRQAA